MAQAMAWVNLEDITPRGGCQTPKATYPMTPGQEVDSWLPGLGGCGTGQAVAEGGWVSSSGDGNALRWPVVTVTQAGEDRALNPTDPPRQANRLGCV